MDPAANQAPRIEGVIAVPENGLRVNLECMNVEVVERTTPSPGTSSVVLIYATFPSAQCAESIAGELVDAELIACANIVPGMRSIYKWERNVHYDSEVLAILKTRAVLAGRVVGWLRVSHPYVNPAAVVLPVVGGSADFLGWIGDETANQAV